MPFPGVYPDDNKIIPYSPRRRFGFASPSGTMTDKVITLESMKNMSIDQIVELYKDGYTIDTLPFENAPPATFERERKYGFMDDKVPPGSVEQYEMDKKYGFTGQGSQLIIGSDVLLLGVVTVLAYLYLKKK